MIHAQNIPHMATTAIADRKETTIFSIPIGRLGLFSRLMMGGACGFIAFFVAFVLAIVGVSIYDSATGASLTNLNIAYLYIAAPVGILAMLASLTYLIGAWARRKFSSAE
jgi:hypothetical protein